MTRLIFLFATFFSTVFSAENSIRGVTVKNEDIRDDWEIFYDFQERFSKKYDDSFELEDRFNIFRENIHNIISHNAMANKTFTMDINQFSDLTEEEFRSKHVGGLFRNKYAFAGISIGSKSCEPFIGTGAKLPASVDWRTKNAVTPVKDQGQCGSCWSFSATGAIEGAWAVTKGSLVSLSEQELVDCAGIKYGSMGCNGGLMEGAFNFAIDNGICADASYTYTSGSTQTGGTCKKCSSVVTVKECFDVKPSDQVSLKEAVSIRPVAIAIEADTRYFQSYSTGILTSATCGTNLDHGVLIVGYGEDSGQKYWLVKNSWGTTWGDGGYLKIARSESTSDGGICGIAMQPSFVTV